MIGRLRGEIAKIQAHRVLIDVGGVGYDVACPGFTLSSLVLGSSASLLVHTEMRDSEIRLYGFHTELERQLFEFLLQVNGVGPKSALEILSSLEAPELIRVIGNGDVARIQRAKGIGKKTAERIVLELRDKVSTYAAETLSLKQQIVVVPESSLSEDSILALLALGFSKHEAELAVGKALKSGGDFEEASDVIKSALAYL